MRHCLLFPLLYLAIAGTTHCESDIWQRHVIEKKADAIHRQVTEAIQKTSRLPELNLVSIMLSLRVERDALIMTSNQFRVTFAGRIQQSFVNNPNKEKTVRSLLAASELTFASLPLTTRLPLYLTDRWTTIHRHTSLEMITAFVHKLHDWNEEITNSISILRSHTALHPDTLYVMASQFYRRIMTLKKEYRAHVSQSDKWHHYVYRDIVQKTKPDLPEEMVDAIADKLM